MAIRIPYIGLFLIGRGRLLDVIRDSFAERLARRQPYERPRPDAPFSLLIAGDSSAVGVGASRPDRGLGGLFAAAHPDWNVRVAAKGGSTVGRVPKLLEAVAGERFDAAVILAGGNDILQFVPYAVMARDLERAIDRAKRVATRVVLVHQGNLGNVPLFPRWFAARLAGRSLRWRDIVLAAAAAHGLGVVDLFHEPETDPWRHGIGRFYSRDLFHPGDDGYRMWFEEIEKVLENMKFPLAA